MIFLLRCPLHPLGCILGQQVLLVSWVLGLVEHLLLVLGLGHGQQVLGFVELVLGQQGLVLGQHLLLLVSWVLGLVLVELVLGQHLLLLVSWVLGLGLGQQQGRVLVVPLPHAPAWICEVCCVSGSSST